MKKNINPIIVWPLIGIIVFVIIFVVFSQIKNSSLSTNNNSSFSSNNEKKNIEEKKDVIVIFDYGNGKVRRFKGPVNNGGKIFDAIQNAAAVGGINIETDKNFMVQSIGEFKNSVSDKNWSLYLNNKKQKLILTDISINPGDEILFRFE